MGDDVCLFNQDAKIHWTLADVFVVNCNAPLSGAQRHSYTVLVSSELDIWAEGYERVLTFYPGEGH